MVAVVSRALASHADCWQKVVSLSHSAPCPCLATRVELGEEVNMWGPCCPWAVLAQGVNISPRAFWQGRGWVGVIGVLVRLPGDPTVDHAAVTKHTWTQKRICAYGVGS